jgi:hypothetical protein
MKPIIETTPGAYGFGRDWTLKAFGKEFYLGQDSKFCSRSLGMTGTQVAFQIGTNDLSSEETRQDLASFIIEMFDLDEEKIKNLEPWDLCCQ